MKLESLPRLVEPSVGEGRFGRVFADPKNEEYLVKVFRSPATNGDADRLVRLADANSRMPKSVWYMLQKRTSWCVGFFGSDQNRIEGVRIPKAAESFYIVTSQRNEAPVKSECGLELLLFADWFRKPIFTSVPFTDVPYDDRIELAFELVTIFQFLWSTGYYFSDFSGKNILWSPAPYLEIFVIDTDSVITADERNFAHSHDWFPPDNLTISEADRSLVALAVWRILSLEALSYPSRNPMGHLIDAIKKKPESVVDSLIDAWATGSSQAIDDIRFWLSERRNTTIASTKFRRASDSGFARVVLAYAPHNPTPNESELINRAISQRKLERELEALAPFARQARLRSAVSETGFDFDLAPEAERSTSSSDDWSVIEMVLDGKYDDVADGVHQGQLGPTPSAVVARAVELKLSTFGAPNVKNTSQNNAYVRLEWNWPGWFGANAVVVEVIDQSGSVLQSKVVPRNDGGIITVDKSFFPKEELRLRLRFACLPPVGDHIASPVLTLFPIGLGLREKAVPNVMTGSVAPEPTRVVQPRVTVAVNDGNSGERNDGVTPVRPPIIVQPPIEITPETPPIGGKSSFFGRILNFFTRRR